MEAPYFATREAESSSLSPNLEGWFSSKFTPHPSPHLRHLFDQPLFCPYVCSRAHLSSFFVSVVPLWNSVNPSVLSFFFYVTVL